MTVTQEQLCQRYLAAVSCLQRGDLERARRELELLTMEAPRFAAAWDGLGCCYEADGDLERAGECFRRAMRLDRRNWRSRYNWGSALHRAGELREACRWLRDAARRQPQERCILHRLGQCHFDLGEFEEAIRCYRRALELPERDVRDAELFLAIGDAERERGDPEAAEKAYERACLLSPDDPALYYRWSLAALRRGDLADAGRLAARAHALDPRSLRSALLLVRLAMDAGDWEGAAARIADLERAPDRVRLAHALRAELARRQGDPKTARRRALEALAMDGPPSDQAVDSALATLRELRGERARCCGFRFVVEVLAGERSYFRPYVVLARDAEEAQGFVAELQEALDASPWRVTEVETFAHEGEALPGVYHLLLTRVLFPRE